MTVLDILAQGEGIATKYSDIHPLVNLDYTIFAKRNSFADKLRGALIDLDRFELVAYGMDRFYSLPAGMELDLSEYYCYEKLDGTLIQMYYYAGEWRVKTRGTCYAEGQVRSDSTMTFADLAWQAFADAGYTESMLLPACTYSFELTSQHNRVVVSYDRPELRLLAIRDLTTLEELDIAPFGDKFTLPAMLEFESVADLYKHLDATSPLETEGFVLQHKQTFHRYKVKSLQYMQMHGLLGKGLKQTSLAKLWLSGLSDELISVRPELEQELDAIADKAKALLTGLTELYEQADKTNAKAFALSIKDRHPLWNRLFAVYKDGKPLDLGLLKPDDFA